MRLRNDIMWTAGAIVGCTVVIVLTMTSSQFWRVGSLFCLAVVALAGLHILTGLARVISLCHAALVGVGAYTAGLLALRFGVCPIVAVAGGIVAGGLISWLLARCTYSLEDHYLTLATLAASEILTNIFRSATDLTGGANGLAAVPPLSVNGLILRAPHAYFPVCAMTAGVALLAAWALQQSSLGKALRASGDAGILVETMGISGSDLRLAGFVIGGCFAGLAGGLAAHVDGFVGPESFGVERSMGYLCFLVIGGLGRLRSILVAAVFAALAPEILRGMVGWQMVILASSAIVVLYLTSGERPAFLNRLCVRMRCTGAR